MNFIKNVIPPLIVNTGFCMVKIFIFILFAGFFVACATHSKRVDRDFTTSKETIKLEKSKFLSSKNEILYILMVDRVGKVVKVKLLDFKEKKLKNGRR